MLDVTRLRVLVAVARHGSVTAAARALNYAQPSVSHHLSRLEAETGALLTQRAGRGVRLTDAGRLLAERAEEILGRLDAAENELAAHVGLRAGRVRLAAFPSALSTLVPIAAARLEAENPGLDLTLAEAEPPEALRMLRAGYVDVALVFRHYQDGVTVSPPGDADEGTRSRLLLDDPIHLVTRAPAAAPGSRAAAAGRVPPRPARWRCRPGRTWPTMRTTGGSAAASGAAATSSGSASWPDSARRSRSPPTTSSRSRPSSRRAWGSRRCRASRSGQHATRLSRPHRCRAPTGRCSPSPTARLLSRPPWPGSSTCSA